MFANENLINVAEQTALYHTQELLGRLKLIVIFYTLSALTILFCPISFLELNFSLDEYKPAIISVLEWLLVWATKEIAIEQFSVTVGSPMAVVIAYIELAMILAFILNIPFIAWQIYLFLAPGMYPGEKKALKLITYSAIGLFTIGAAFGFYLMPIVTRTLVSIAGTLEYEHLVQFYDLNLLIEFLFWNVVATGLVFMYPILILSLVLFGLISTKNLQERRRHVISALLGITAIITPDPTPVSMIILTLPLIFIYEITINISFKLEKSSFYKEFRSNTGFNLERLKISIQ